MVGKLPILSHSIMFVQGLIYAKTRGIVEINGKIEKDE
jgi:hypothetical protein